MVLNNSQLLTCLVMLGESSEQVAISLLEMGFSGILNHASRCLIANYLNELREEKLKSTAIVSDIWIRTYMDERNYYMETAKGRSGLKFPPAINRFINDFDKGCYPSLVSHPWNIPH